MARHHGPVLVDTNVILECHRTGSWRALTGGYSVETVEDCVTETHTGFQRRRTERQIDILGLRASLKTVHVVGPRQRAERPPTRSGSPGRCCGSRRRGSPACRTGGAGARHRAGPRRGFALGARDPSGGCLAAMRTGQSQPALRGSARIPRPAGVPGKIARRRGSPVKPGAERGVHKKLARQDRRPTGSGRGKRFMNRRLPQEDGEYSEYLRISAHAPNAFNTDHVVSRRRRLAVSGSSIAKITFDLSLAMNVRSENTIALMTPDPSHQYGTETFDRSEDPNSVIDRRRLSRVGADGCRRDVRSSPWPSCKSCSASFPRTARSSTKRRRRGTASGASATRS